MVVSSCQGRGVLAAPPRGEPTPPHFPGRIVIQRGRLSLCWQDLSFHGLENKPRPPRPLSVSQELGLRRRLPTLPQPSGRLANDGHL